jgi:hypothetical protein
MGVGIGYYFMINSGVFGSLHGNFNNTLLDCTYFSFTNYSTLGVSDVEPIGHIRFLVGLEALIRPDHLDSLFHLSGDAESMGE